MRWHGTTALAWLICSLGSNPHWMNVGKTLFAQVMEFVPWKTFARWPRSKSKCNISRRDNVVWVSPIVICL
jgi:hypothetical protein